MREGRILNLFPQEVLGELDVFPPISAHDVDALEGGLAHLDLPVLDLRGEPGDPVMPVWAAADSVNLLPGTTLEAISGEVLSSTLADILDGLALEVPDDDVIHWRAPPGSCGRGAR